MQFVPPRKVFQQSPKDPKARHEASCYTIDDFEYPTRTKTGGMASVFKGHPFPRKGFIYEEAVMATNKAKRLTLALFRPLADVKKGLIGFLDSYLYNYTRLVDSVFDDCKYIPYLHYEYYCEFSKAAWHFTYFFLRYLGVSFNTAYKTGLVVATIFENDDAYKLRPQDILSETTKAALLADPRAEIRRLLPIYVKRELLFNGDPRYETAGSKILNFTKLVSYLLLLPPIRKAFRFALENVKFEWFQYDELDSYWSMGRIDYNVMGLTFEERKLKVANILYEYAKRTNPGKQVMIEDAGDRLQIKVIDNANPETPDEQPNELAREAGAVA